MVNQAFHPKGADDTIGPTDASDPGHDATPGIYALQHHLVPEDVREELDDAQAVDANWFSEEDFGADARLAWAWAPPDLW